MIVRNLYSNTKVGCFAISYIWFLVMLMNQIWFISSSNLKLSWIYGLTSLYFSLLHLLVKSIIPKSSVVSFAISVKFLMVSLIRFLVKLTPPNLLLLPET